MLLCDDNPDQVRQIITTTEQESCRSLADRGALNKVTLETESTLNGDNLLTDACWFSDFETGEGSRWRFDVEDLRPATGRVHRG
jgi:hypothetical protein